MVCKMDEIMVVLSGDLMVRIGLLFLNKMVGVMLFKGCLFGCILLVLSGIVLKFVNLLFKMIL